MSKVVLFSRVSTLGQDLTQQTDELYAEARRNGYKEKDIILIEQKESAIKLDESERIGIQKLKEVISKEKVECVIVYEISRLARRPTVLYSVRDHLIENGVNLICMKPYMRLLDPDGKMSQTASILFSLFGALSESEMMIKKERMNRGRISKRERLKYIGGHMLFGYTWNKETDDIYINEDERETVIEIFERYADNESVRSIAKDLIDRGRLRYDDYATACVMLRRMIRRSEYAGIKADTYDYPAIISQELYNKVRTRAATKNKYKTRVSEIYYLQGLIHWKRNGMLMSPSKHTVQYKGWDERTNTGTMINLDYVESLAVYFTKRYKERISGEESTKMYTNLFNEMNHVLQRQRNTIEEHREIESTIERINERIVKGKMSEEQGDRLIEEQQARYKELDNMMKRCAEDMRHLEKQMKSLNENNNEDICTLSDERMQSLIKQCIKKVNVEVDNITNHGKIIEIYMMDGIKHTIHMTKKGNDFITYIVHKDKETRLDNLEIKYRFVRKIYDKKRRKK